jgi:general secretion pathway protein G
VDQAKEAVLRENLRVVRQTIDKFAGDQNRYPDSLQELVERGYLMAVPLDPITESASTWELIAPAEPSPGQVRDIKSGASGQASNGQPFRDW